jgi:IS30 family transposase
LHVLFSGDENNGLPLGDFWMSLCYSQLTLFDRRRLHQLMERKVPVGENARQLGRHRSTINRELKRTTFHDAEFPEYSGYYDGIANDISKERRQRLRKLRRHPQLRELVIEQLKGALVAGADRRSPACRWRKRRPCLHRDDLSLYLWQGRLCAGALSAFAGRPPQAPPTPRPQAP